MKKSKDMRVAQSAPPAKPRPKQILLVDDDDTVRDSLRAVLESDGYAVVPAGDGLQAIELASSQPIDLVLLDLNMPRQSGWDTFERLSSQCPLVPVIVITARPNQLFTAVSAGVGALLEKPLDIPMLLETITSLLSEPAEARLARLAGRSTHFYFNSGRLEPQKK